MKKRIVLVENYDVTKTLAVSLLKKKYHVTVIQKEEAKCEQLAEIEGLQVIHGDGTKPYILEEAEVDQAMMVIAMTESDAGNLVICELCKKKFGVPKTICTIKNAENTNFFRQMGVDAVISTTNTITNLIEQQAFLDEMATSISLGEGRLSVTEIAIKEGAPSAGKKLWEITLPSDVIVGCILRQEHTIIPRGDTRILPGDKLVVMSKASQEKQAIKELTGRDLS